VLGGKPNDLVQILKDNSGGPRLSCEISLPGRFVVITSFNNIFALSKKKFILRKKESVYKKVREQSKKELWGNCKNCS
jgi:ribonuclease G